MEDATKRAHDTTSDVQGQGSAKVARVANAQDVARKMAKQAVEAGMKVVAAGVIGRNADAEEEKKDEAGPTSLTFLNLTPHDCTLYYNDAEGNEQSHTFPRSGLQAPRVKTEQTALPDIVMGNAAFSVVTPCVATGVEPLPAEADVIIVSGWYAEEYLKYADPTKCILVSPDSGPESVVRDEGGNITGTKRFIRWN